MKHFHRHALVLIVLVAAAGAEPGALPPKEVKTQLLAEWESVCRQAKTLRGEMSVEYYASKDGRPLRVDQRSVVKYAANEGGVAWQVESHDLDENGAIRSVDTKLSLQNKDYKASLKKASRGDSWVLQEYAPVDQADTNTKEEKLQHWACHWLLCANFWMQKWVADDGFVVQKMEACPGAGTPGLVRIHFAYFPERGQLQTQGPGAAPPIPSGFFEVDRDRQSRIMKYQFLWKSQRSEGVKYGEFAYAKHDGNMPLLESFREDSPRISTVKSGLMSARETRKFTIDYHPRIDEEEFRLSHYGIPEPGNAAPKHNWTFWILLASGVTLLALVFFLHRRRSALASG